MLRSRAFLGATKRGAGTTTRKTKETDFLGWITLAQSDQSLFKATAPPAFEADVSRSARSSCRACGHAIPSGVLRMGPSFPAMMGDFLLTHWYHFDCFKDSFLCSFPPSGDPSSIAASHRGQVLTSPSDVKGFHNLHHEHQMKILELIHPTNTASSLLHGGNPAARIRHEKFISIHEALAIKSVVTSDVVQECINVMYPTKGTAATNAHKAIREQLLDSKRLSFAERAAVVADAMVYGLLPVCSRCQSSTFTLRGSRFKCSGHVNEFLKCSAYFEDLTVDVNDNSTARRGGDHTNGNISANADASSPSLPSSDDNVIVSGKRLAWTMPKAAVDWLTNLVASSPTPAVKAWTPRADVEPCPRHLPKDSAASQPLPESLSAFRALWLPAARLSLLVPKMNELDEAADVAVRAGARVSRYTDTAKISAAVKKLDLARDAVPGTRFCVIHAKAGFLESDALRSALSPFNFALVTPPWLYMLAARRGAPPTFFQSAETFVFGGPPETPEEKVKRIDARTKIIKHRQEEAMSSSGGGGNLVVTASGQASGPAASAKTAKVVVTVSDRGHALDSQCDVADAVVFQDYTATLTKADLASGRNAFYIMHVIQTPNSSFSVYRRWGRVGEEMQSSKATTSARSKHHAIELFEKFYEERTGRQWRDRAKFEPLAGKYVLLDARASTDTGSASDGGKGKQKSSGDSGSGSSTKTSLPPTTASLIRLLFDNQTMTKAMLSMDIDTSKMPLGTLSANTLNKGKAALLKIQHVLESIAKQRGGKEGIAYMSKESTYDELSQSERDEITSLSNQFFTYVPQVVPKTVIPVAAAAPPTNPKQAAKRAMLISTPEKVAAKLAHIDDLLDIVHTQQLRKLSESMTDPLLGQYQSLGVTLQPIEPTSDMGKLLTSYFLNTQGSTHRSYKVKDIWSLERNGELDRFQPWKKDANRKLLWHGSRLTNWVRIMNQGLRIAPPEAPSTGYMFGKGVYFADMSSKSCNYCNMGYRETGLIALAEVALGNPQTRYAADYIVPPLPLGVDSTFAIGKTMPDPKKDHVLDDGVVVPMGKGVATKDSRAGYLLYNEFIVYDVSKIRLRYLMTIEL